MRLKTYLSKLVHTDFTTCVGWLTPEEVVTCGDDHKLLIWNTVTHDLIKALDLPKSLYPTDLHTYPKSVSGSRQRQAVAEQFVLGDTNGNYHILNRNGKIEKSVDAHKGAVLVVRWSNDGAALASGGEDGQVKIWSKAGMLRSTLSAHSTPAYTLSWGPNSDCVVYSIESTLEVKALSPKSKPLQWKAHDGLVLKVAWNQNNNLIISGSEDCRYRVWDAFGRLLFSSGVHDYPITALGWSPDGTLFAVGSFNTLKLCDQSGWSHSLDKPQVHSVLNLSWSNDSTQLSGATASGVVIFSSVVDSVLQWKSFELTATGRKLIKIRDVTTTAEEEHDFRENIIKISMEFGYLIVITTNQCHIYKLNNLSTPHTFDLRDPNVSLVIQCDRHFVIVDALNVNLYSYEGRHLNNFKWVGLRIDALTKSSLSLSCDTLAARDSGDHKIIHFIDTQSGKETLADGKAFTHKIEINTIALNLCESPNERKCAFIDKNADLHLTVVRPSSFLLLRSVKLIPMVTHILWNDEANVLAGVQENNKLHVWLYPHVGFVDKELLDIAVYEKELSEVANKKPQLVSFYGNQVTLRRADGSLTCVYLNPFVIQLHSYVNQMKWNEALRLCRYLKNSPDSIPLWAALAGMALNGRQLSTAEIAYAEVDKVDKVFHIQKIRQISDKDVRQAEIALISGNVREAENVLLLAGFVLRAILLNIDTYKWERALELATRSENTKKYLGLVLALRKKHLEKFDKSEDIKKFLQISDEVTSIPDNFAVQEMIKNSVDEKLEGVNKSARQARN